MGVVFLPTLWQGRKRRTKQPKRKNTIAENSWKVNHLQQILLLFISCYKSAYSRKKMPEFPWGFSHGAFICRDQAQLGAPADCLYLPGWLPPAVVSPDYDNVILLLLFVLSCDSFTQGDIVLCLGLFQLRTPACFLNGLPQSIFNGYS